MITVAMTIEDVNICRAAHHRGWTCAKMLNADRIDAEIMRRAQAEPNRTTSGAEWYEGGGVYAPEVINYTGDQETARAALAKVPQ